MIDEIDDDAVCWLSARVTPGDGKCVQYRRSGSVSCRDCDAYKPVVAAVVAPVADIIVPVEIPMPVKECSVSGCTKLSQSGCHGKCKSHYKNTPARTLAVGKAKTVAVVAPVVEEHIEVIDDLALGEDFCNVCGTYPCGCFDEDGTYNPIETFDTIAAPHVPSSFEQIGFDIGTVVTEKNMAYGNSFALSGEFLRLLYPNGISPDQYEDALGLVRVFDKQKRIATNADAFGESPWSDISGYGLLGVARRLGML